MSNVNERLYQIEKMIEKIIDDKKSIKEVHNMINWKRGVDDGVQLEQHKLDDIFYFLNGILFEKGIVKSWGGNLKD